eukprot:m.112861 g.112861  ORF g.112861 m.112861 type:complete len:83 (+) comp17046_c0_seq1:1120-1368(+)
MWNSLDHARRQLLPPQLQSQLYQQQRCQRREPTPGVVFAYFEMHSYCEWCEILVQSEHLFLQHGALDIHLLSLHELCEMQTS